MCRRKKSKINVYNTAKFCTITTGTILIKYNWLSSKVRKYVYKIDGSEMMIIQSLLGSRRIYLNV